MVRLVRAKTLCEMGCGICVLDVASGRCKALASKDKLYVIVRAVRFHDSDSVMLSNRGVSRSLIERLLCELLRRRELARTVLAVDLVVRCRLAMSSGH